MHVAIMGARVAAWYGMLWLLCGPRVAGFAGWVDPDTPPELKTTTSFTTKEQYELVMSDEFKRAGRSFKDGDDPMWTGVDKSDDDQTASGRKSLHFYNASQITTEGGKLVITTTTEDTKWKGWNPYKKKYETMSRHFKSGMLQSWNKFCFTGGIIEAELQFPGRHDTGGLWPAFWLLGNLGRATFESSTNLMWPWSYDTCNRDLQMAQEISGCDVTSHYSLSPGVGRGATEIDIVEVMPGPAGKLPICKNGVQRPYSSMTLQLAPGVPASVKRPSAGTLPEWGFTWYKNLTYGPDTSINPFFYGTYLAATKTEEPIARSEKESYQCDAISSMTTINETYFKGPKKFRLEWQPGPAGYVRWYINGVFRFGIDATSLTPWGTKVPDEPSYVILNTAISTSWGFPNPPWGCTEYDCKTSEGQCGMNAGFCKSLPAQFLIDSVRVYQKKSDPRQTVGCNPKERPTRKWIAGHAYRYKNADDAQPLKLPIRTGGGSCRTNADCGEGSCAFLFCRCKGGWQGPHCLVPTYKDDFPDWEAEQWVFLTAVAPYVPSSLALGALALLGGLGAALYAVVQRRRDGDEASSGRADKSPNWL